MYKYKIFETKQYISDLTKDFAGQHLKIRKKIENYVYPQIKQNPHYGLNIKKLKNYSPETWRYRIGNYRIFYEIDEKEKLIIIVTIDSRQDCY